MYDYKPWYFRIKKGISRSIEVHFGIWLATLEIKSRWRFLVALLMIPSGVGAYLLFWNYSYITVVAAILFHGWLFFKVLRGESLDA